MVNYKEIATDMADSVFWTDNSGNVHARTIDDPKLSRLPKKIK